MLKICLVGVGGMGNVHYANYQHIEDVKVVCLVGKADSDIVKAKEWGLPIYDSITEANANCEFDVVDICTPTFLHCENALEAFNINKDVILEKPLALSYADGKKIIDMANDKNLKLYVAFVLQYTKEYQKLRELVESKEFGKVLDASFTRLSSIPEWAIGGWLFDENKSGLIPFDLHIHDLDIITSLFGEPTNINVSTSKRQEATYVEHYRFNYTFDNLNVVSEASWHYSSIPFTATFRVLFENAALIYEGKSLVAYPYHQDPIEYNITDDILVETGINVPPTGWYYNELSYIVECIKNNQLSKYVTYDQLLVTLNVLEEVKRHK